MNINYSLAQLAQITNGKVREDKDLLVNRVIIDNRSPKITTNTLFVDLKGKKQMVITSTIHLLEMVERFY